MMIIRPGTDRNDKQADAWEVLANRRILHLRGDIDWGTSISFRPMELVASMLVLASEARDPIKLRIMSPGGNVEVAKWLYRVIRYIDESCCPIYTIGGTDCCSAAASILASGRRGYRYIIPQGRVMIHPVWTSGVHQATDLEKLRKLDKENIEFLVKVCGMNKEQEEEIYNTIMNRGIEKWFDAQKAIEYGFVDKIITPEIYQELFI